MTTPTIGWLVELYGDPFDLDLARNAFSANEPSIVTEGRAFFLTSTQWAPIEEAQAIRDLARQAAAMMSDSLHLLYRDSRPFFPGIVTRVNEDGTRQAYDFGEANIVLDPVRLTASASIGGPASPPAEHPAIGVYRSAAQRSDVRDALRYFTIGDWVSLYKAVEIVKDGVGPEQIFNLKWITKGALRRFNQTAQSSRALGGQARHASIRFRAPANPMSLHEARALVGDLLQAWVVSLAGTRQSP